MNKHVLLFACVICFSLNIAWSQDNNRDTMVIGVYPFLSSGAKEDIDEAGYLSSMVNDILVKNGSFKVVPRTVTETVQKELDLNKLEMFISGDIAEQGKALGAKKLLAGIYHGKKEGDPASVDMPSHGLAHNLSLSGNKSYMSFTLTLVDVATGKAENSSTFNVSTVNPGISTSIGGTKVSTSNSGTAFTSANKIAKRRVANWIITLLPYNLKIFRVEESDSKDLPKTVLIRGGKDFDLGKGEVLEVLKVENMGDGTFRKVPIGELSVTEVQGDYTLCKVVKGAKEIKAGMDGNSDLKLLFKEDE